MNSTRKETLSQLILAVLVGLLFLLPHLTRIAVIGSAHDYTPFAADSASPTVWDETFLYASEANYMFLQHKLAYDTDAYEHRNEPFPYSVLPVGIVAAIASMTGSLAAAQIICHFLFPAITTWLLISFFRQLRASTLLAALLSLLILVIGFSPRTLLLGDSDILRHGLHGNFVDTLQAARNPHPNMSFPLFLAACICIAYAITHRSHRLFLSAGVLGGLLFYSYTFYAIAWSGACFFLFLLSFWSSIRIPRSSILALASTGFIALPFFLWSRASKASGAYWNRTSRLGLIRSHMLTKTGVKISIAWLVLIVCLLALWSWYSRKASEADRETTKYRLTRAAIAVFTCAALGGIAGLNMQILTGFNIQPEAHFPHMVIQPAVLVLAAIVLLAWLPRWNGLWSSAPKWSLALFALLFVGCCLVQIDAGYHSAPRHRMLDADRKLYDWLLHNTSDGAVVATTDLRLSVDLPVYTHNSILMVNGTRTSGPDEESLQRFLVANALTGMSATQVNKELKLGFKDRAYWPIPSSTYTYYLFEHSPYRDESGDNVFDRYIPALMNQYAAIQADPSQALQKFRVDYIYTENGQTPPSISGWRATPVLQNPGATLWHLYR
jgi:hypothetical protein